MTGETSSQLPPEVVELMNTLVDVHAPADPGWWPPAIGWWVTAILIVTFLAFSIKFAMRAMQRRQWNKCLSEELVKIQQASLSDARFCQHINQLLKRVVQAKFTEEHIRELSGQAWVDYLQNKLSTKDSDIDLSSLGDICYQPTLHVDRNQVVNSVRKWMEACC